MHWNITDRFSINFDYDADSFIGIDFSVGYSGLTESFQIVFTLGALSLCLLYYLGNE